MLETTSNTFEFALRPLYILNKLFLMHLIPPIKQNTNFIVRFFIDIIWALPLITLYGFAINVQLRIGSNELYCEGAFGRIFDIICFILSLFIFVTTVSHGIAYQNRLTSLVKSLNNYSEFRDIFTSARIRNINKVAVLPPVCVFITIVEYIIYGTPVNKLIYDAFLLLNVIITMYCIIILASYAEIFTKIFQHINRDILYAINVQYDNLRIFSSCNTTLDLTVILNEIYSILVVQILGRIFYLFLVFLNGTNYINVLQQICKTSLGNFLIAIKWCILSYWCIYYIVWCFNSAEKENNKVGLLIHEYWNKYAERLSTAGQALNFKLLSLQMKHNKLQFNVLGFFDLRYTLLFMIVESAATYTLIVSQFADIHDHVSNAK